VRGALALYDPDIEAGLLMTRIRRDECGLAINELTEDGKWLAVNLHIEAGHA
jgi:hypothetical protein